MTPIACARVPAARPVPHPIPYQGSKRALGPTILQFLPADTTTLVEPFAGSAALSLAAVRAKRCERVALSDINGPLMALWAEIIATPDRLADRYEDLWDRQTGRETDFYNEIRDEFNRSAEPALLLYLLARCVKAAVRYNSRGEFNQSPDRRRRGTRPATMRRHLHGAHELLRPVARTSCVDYRDALRDTGTGDVVYLDPPYRGVSGQRDRRYVAGMPEADFRTELAALNERELSFILSYDGRTGGRTYGDLPSESLGLTHIEIDAGRSSTSTLLGRTDRTVESLYLSAALVRRLGGVPGHPATKQTEGPAPR